MKVKSGRPAKRPRKGKTTVVAGDGGEEAPGSDSSGGDGGGGGGGGGGVYCICRKPDDHRWMICCERCEDWFHGECVALDKGMGEGLVERFVCPRCVEQDAAYVTRYKKSCALVGCGRPARLPGYAGVEDHQQSVFCSQDHCHEWWDRTVALMPSSSSSSSRADRVHELAGQISQQDFVALVQSRLGGSTASGQWRLTMAPFTGDDDDAGHDNTEGHWTGEERRVLADIQAARRVCEEEISLCEKMILVVDRAQARWKRAVAAGLLPSDACGYDSRLEGVTVTDPFRHFLQTPAGAAMMGGASETRESMDQTIPRTMDQTLPRTMDQEPTDGPPSAVPQPEDDDDVHGLCDKRRCKQHHSWHAIIKRDLRLRIRHQTVDLRVKQEEEEALRRTSRQRFLRQRVERNWVIRLAEEDALELDSEPDSSAATTRTRKHPTQPTKSKLSRPAKTHSPPQETTLDRVDNRRPSDRDSTPREPKPGVDAPPPMRSGDSQSVVVPVPEDRMDTTV